MSPPANLGLLTQQRINQNVQTSSLALGQSSLSLPSQHKRSLSFNHHLSYNQYTGGNQHPVNSSAHAAGLPPPTQQQQQPQSLPTTIHPVISSSTSIKSNSVQIAGVYQKATTTTTMTTPSQPQSLPTPPTPPALLLTNTTTNTRNAKGSPKGTSISLLFMFLSHFYFYLSRIQI